MFDKLKAVLDALNSALSELKEKIAGVDKTKEEIRVKGLKQDELADELKAKAEELNTRELAVKEIESIVDFSNQAKDLMVKAKDLMKNAEERQGILEGQFKKLSKDRQTFEKEQDNAKVANQKQVDALKAEREEFDAKVKAYKALAKAVK